jgi:RNA polymerase sigma factor (sigma-70 family)
VQRVEDEPPIANKRAYLYRLAANLAIDHAKSESRRAAIHAQASLRFEAEEAQCGEAALLARDDLQRIAAVVGTLPERTRHVFVLNRIEGLSQREVATRLGISKPTVEKHLARAFEAVASVVAIAL